MSKNQNGVDGEKLRKIVKGLNPVELEALTKEARREKARKTREAKNKRIMDIGRLCIKHKDALLRIEIPADLKNALSDA